MIASSVASPTASSVSNQSVSPSIWPMSMISSAGVVPAPAMAEMTFQLAIDVVWMAELNASSWVNTVGQSS